MFSEGSDDEEASVKGQESDEGKEKEKEIKRRGEERGEKKKRGRGRVCQKWEVRRMSVKREAKKKTMKNLDHPRKYIHTQSGSQCEAGR